MMMLSHQKKELILYPLNTLQVIVLFKQAD